MAEGTIAPTRDEIALALHRCDWPGGYGWTAYLEMADSVLELFSAQARSDKETP
jgi:hypothetical protein